MKVRNVVVNKKQIEIIVDILVSKIDQYYDREQTVIIIVVEPRAKRFSSDLLKKLPEKFGVCPVVSKKTISDVELDMHNVPSLTGRNVLVVDAICESGKTISKILKELDNRSPSMVDVCVLIDKYKSRTEAVPLRFVGARVDEDGDLVGYGVDSNGEGRDFPFIFVVDN